MGRRTVSTRKSYFSAEDLFEAAAISSCSGLSVCLPAVRNRQLCQRRLKFGSSAILVQLRVPFGQQVERAVRMEGCGPVTKGSLPGHTSAA